MIYQNEFITIFMVADGHNGSECVNMLVDRVHGLCAHVCKALFSVPGRALSTMLNETIEEMIKESFSIYDLSILYPLLKSKNQGSTCCLLLIEHSNCESIREYTSKQQVKLTESKKVPPSDISDPSDHSTSSSSSGSSFHSNSVENSDFGIQTQRAWIVNLGDSRAAIYDRQTGQLKFMSLDHKPGYPLEKARIENVGGRVTHGTQDIPRINGYTALSRGFGDYHLKPHLRKDSLWLSNIPDVYSFDLRDFENSRNSRSSNPNHSKELIILLATDGLWDKINMIQCGQILKNKASKKKIPAIFSSSNSQSSSSSSSFSQKKSLSGLEKLWKSVLGDQGKTKSETTIKVRTEFDNISLLAIGLIKI